jgi:hypothetical protein
LARQELAGIAKDGCPVSKILNTGITLDAKLAGETATGGILEKFRRIGSAGYRDGSSQAFKEFI